MVAGILVHVWSGPWIWGQVVEKIKRAVYKLRRVQLKLLGQATSFKQQATSLPQSGGIVTKNRKEKDGY